MRLNLVPMLWMIVPFVLVVAQLQFHYGFRGLEVGEPTLFKVQMAGSAPAGATRPAIELGLPQGLRASADPVWIPTRGEMTWRLVADAAGSYEVTIAIGSETLTKRVEVSDAVVQRAPDRLAPGFLNQLIYPAEPPLPADSGVAAISVIYPDREVGLLGFETHWLIVFLILSVAIAFALKDRFGVTI